MNFINYLSLLKKKLRSKKESYSFGTVDLLINYFFKNKFNGFYVDVGCQNPISNNNTYLLHKNKNWKGINIDLDPENIKLFNISRPNDININKALSSSVKEMDLYFYHKKSAINTISKEIADRQNAKVKEIKKISTTTLDLILEKNNVQKINYLSIDVEGHEFEVLSGFSIQKYNPDIVSIEYLNINSIKFEFHYNNIDDVINSQIYKYFVSNNYNLVNWNHADLIFVNKNNC